MSLTVPVYLYFSLAASVSSLILGCCFLFISVPDIPVLSNYKRTRILLAAAYFILGIGNIFSIIGKLTGITINITELFPLILSISALQAFLFSYTLITLLTPEFLTKKKLSRELSLIFFFILLCSSVSFTDNNNLFQFFCSLFFCYYLFQLYSYTRAFIIEDRKFTARLNSFYSGSERKQLNWLRKAFFSALTIGMIAGLCLVFLSDTWLILTISFYSVFYVFFAIKYINYPQLFVSIQESFVPVTVETVPASSYHQLSQKLEAWEHNKGFTNSGITINELASELSTNRTYLSSYINSTKKMNFNTWVNSLRVEEAQRLMKDHPDWTIARISEETGFADSSCFGKQFRKITGLTPRTARINYLKELSE